MKLTKKLFIAIMTMALVVVTFTTSTFAWFTLGTKGEIKDVQVNVTAGVGMEISKDGTAWKNVIQLANPDGLNFTAVTTLDGKTFYDAETTGALVNQANAKYYEQKFYVRIRKDTATGSSITKVLLSQVEGNNGTGGTGTEWTADVTLGTALDTQNPVYTHYKNGSDNADAIIEGQARTFDALNAVKVSFSTPRTSGQTTTDTVTVLYGYENTNSWGTMPSVVDYDHDNDTETAAVKRVQGGLAYDYAEAKGYDMSEVQPYKMDATATALPTYVTYTNGTLAAKGTEESEQDYATRLGKSTVLVNGDFVSAANAKKTNENAAGFIETTGNLDDNYLYAVVTIRIWLDGWDPDCINAILGQKRVFTFQLKAE